MFDLSAPVVALLTPFDRKGRIDRRAFAPYLSALSGWGVRSAVCNGTTAEFPSLTLTERQNLLEFARGHFSGTLINNVSSTCVKDSRKLIRGTQGLGDAVLLLPPYYYAGAGHEGLCRFFAETLAGVSLPVFLYNFPQHTGNPVDGHLIGRLLGRGIELAGIKDSSGRLEHAAAYQAQFPQLKIFHANDFEALAALQAGLTGSVSGGANPLPEFLLAVRKYFGAADGKAQALQRAFNVWNDYRTGSSFPEIPLVKAAMGARLADFPIHVRAPFTALPAEALGPVRAKVEACLAALDVVLDNRS